ncbi:uncharacterized protein [Populus alba]|uniref:uncharacterized protein isoform X2 n=1 Tax=Populus alba TaxID=43335 RepID=UPI003CC75CCE
MAKIILLRSFHWRLFSMVKSCIFFPYLDAYVSAKKALLFGVVQHFNEVFSELVQGGHGHLVMMKKKMLITKMIIVTMDAMKQIWREICYSENEGCRAVLVSCDYSWLMVVKEKQKWCPTFRNMMYQVKLWNCCFH